MTGISTSRLGTASKKNKRAPSREDIEQAETGLWVEQQLNRIRDCIEEHGADDEMLDAINFLLAENDRWLDQQIADALRAGKLSTGKT
jgi:hypothetical protein